MVGLVEAALQPAEPVGVPDGEPKAAAPQKLQKVKRVEKPSKVALEEQVGKVYDEIDGLQVRIHEIKIIIDSKQQNKYFMSQEVVDARNQLNELTSSFRGVMDEKKALREELDAADKTRERMRADARSLREKLPYVRVEQIDEEIKKLEYRMTHTSLTLQEEKKLLQQVKDLTKSRDFVKDYNERMELITLDEASRAEMVQKIREKDELLSGLKARQEEQRKLMARLKERDAAQAVDIPVLIEERNNAFEKTKALREKVKEIRAEFRAREDEYYERERQWREQQAIQRRKDYEKREAERKEREKIRKERELENFVEPYTDEIIICDQLISYLQKHAPVVEEASSTAPVKAEIVAPKGVGNVLISKKSRNDDELDGWFSGSSNKGKGKKSRAPTATKSKEKEKLSLSLDVLTSFQKVKLSPPTTVGDAPKSIEEVKLKKEEYVKMQQVARDLRERGDDAGPSDVQASQPDVLSVPEEKVEESGSVDRESDHSADLLKDVEIAEDRLPEDIISPEVDVIGVRFTCEKQLVFDECYVRNKE
ncbi:hypothetical protein R1sor_023941 [Riccia sorocarpa]|uniref:Uncharacterized protein n=1 Tax=Riccia sorocarpa TaxID=122646 RepID=A0ABD3GP27_9MARC